MAWFLPPSRRERVRLGRCGPLWLWPYSIPVTARHTHLYAIGSTGSGKSKFLEHLIVSDIVAGRGVGLLDPHRDLARDVLAHLASIGFFERKENFNRIIYLDPYRTDYVLPFNVFSVNLPPYLIAQNVIEAIRRAWPKELEAAPRFANIALVAMLVLMETRQTLADLPKLLTDKSYRDQLLSQVSNAQLVDYFHNRFDQWGRETAGMIESVLNKVTAFTFNPYLNPMVASSENRLDFRKIMDEGKVLIVDLGGKDPETQKLIGTLVVTGIEQAALSRTDTAVRRPFYFYIDEFQDYCANDGSVKTLSQILSGCRKFGLYLHLAHQTLGQLHGRVASALGNVGVKVVFGVDREDAEVMARKMFAVDTEAVKHDAQTDTQHPLYSPLSEQWERAVAGIQGLTPRMALVKRRGKNVAHIRTETIPRYAVTEAEVSALQARLACLHGVMASDGGKTDSDATVLPQTNACKDWEPSTPSPHVIFSAADNLTAH